MGKAETDLVNVCLDWLSIKGIVAWRNNTGKLRQTYKGRVRCVAFGKPGSADIFALLHRGRFMAIECKIGSNKPTALQEAFAKMIRDAGAVYVVVYYLDDLVRAINENP